MSCTWKFLAQTMASYSRWEVVSWDIEPHAPCILDLKVQNLRPARANFQHNPNNYGTDKLYLAAMQMEIQFDFVINENSIYFNGLLKIVTRSISGYGCFGADKVFSAVSAWAVINDHYHKQKNQNPSTIFHKCHKISKSHSFHVIFLVVGFKTCNIGLQFSALAKSFY